MRKDFEFCEAHQSGYLTGLGCFYCQEGINPMKKPKDEAAFRKATPIATCVLDYFPRTIVALARLALIGSQQHNPGMPPFWNKEVSTDHADALVRHLMERGGLDTDGMPHSLKVAWRGLALCETELERTEG